MAAKKAAKAKPFHWFQGASVEALAKEIAEYGAGKARVEVHTKGDKMYFHVKGPEGNGGDPINDSHRCPPFCG